MNLMNTKRMTEVLKRVESRRQRALARERRKLRRSGVEPKVEPKNLSQRIIPSAKSIPRSTGGCGGCRKKSKNFRTVVRNSSIATYKNK